MGVLAGGLLLSAGVLLRSLFGVSRSAHGLALALTFSFKRQPPLPGRLALLHLGDQMVALPRPDLPPAAARALNRRRSFPMPVLAPEARDAPVRQRHRAGGVIATPPEDRRPPRRLLVLDET
jgi:hypothetical protein